MTAITATSQHRHHHYVAHTHHGKHRVDAQKSAHKKCHKVIKAVVLNSDTATWFNTMMGEARSVWNIVRHYFSHSKMVHRVFLSTQFGNGLSMPFDLFQLLSGIHILMTQKGKQPIVDNTLDVLNTTSSLADGISTYTGALVDLGAAAAETTQWVSPLGLAAAGLSMVNYAIYGRGIHFSNKALKELAVALKKPEGPDYRRAHHIVKKWDYHLARQGGVDTHKFISVITALEKQRQKQINPAPDQVNEAEAKLAQAYSALKKRVQQKVAGYGIGIVITTINIIASIILFATSLVPFAIAASFLLATLFALIIAKMSLDIASKHRFNKTMKALTIAVPTN